MMALAIDGSATSTSLTSRGSSTTSDLPIPSGRKRAATSPAVATPDSAADAGLSAPITASSAATSDATRINALVPISRFPFLGSFWNRYGRHTETDHVQSAAFAGIVVRILRLIGVGKAAQGERQAAELARQREL